MEIIPAIDLLHGMVVRLVRGDRNSTISYSRLGTPLEIAMRWVEEGAQTVHVIDLGRAFGEESSRNSVMELCTSMALNIHVGGGLRSEESIREILDLEQCSAIIGSLSLEDPPFIERLSNEYGTDKIIVALDHSNGTIMKNAWRNQTTFSLQWALTFFRDFGLKKFLVTSVACDGMLQGPDTSYLESIPEDYRRGIIAAGGVSSLNDVRRLAALQLDGVVVGRALYEGSLSLSDAIGLARRYSK